MMRLAIAILLYMHCLLCIAQSQVGALRHWKDVRDLDTSLINRQLPAYLDATVVFLDQAASFFVIGDGMEGIPVHVVDDFPDINRGDRVHLTGTTMHLLQQPGLRMVTLEKLSAPTQAPEWVDKAEIFKASGPYFKVVEVEGLITSVSKSRGELLLGFYRSTSEAYYLRIPDRIWKGIPARRVVGNWVRIAGLYFPPEHRHSLFSGKSSFVIASLKDIRSRQDLVRSSSATFSKFSELVSSDVDKPVMIEGVLEANSPHDWVLKVDGGSIALDWIGDESSSGKSVRCVGFPALRGEQLAMIPCAVLLEHTTESRKSFDWQRPLDASSEYLTNIASILALDPKQATGIVPVELEVLVTYHQPSWSLMFVQDPTGSIFVTPSEPYPAWLPGGTKLRLRGNVIQGHSMPIIHQAVYEVLGKEDLPHAVSHDFKQIKTGKFDCHYLEISGKVRSAALIGTVLELKIQTDSGSFTAFIREYQSKNNPSDLLDSIVSLTGVCGMEWVNKKAIGFILYMEDASRLQILHPRTYDELPLPVDTIDRQALAEKSMIDLTRIRLEGFLTGQLGKTSFTFQTPSQGFLIETLNEDPEFTMDQSMQITGWPRLQDDYILIEDAVLSPIKPKSELVPLEMEDASTLSPEQIYQMVSFRGRLVDFRTNARQISFILKSSSEQFVAILDVDAAPGMSPSSIELGSLVGVQGVLTSIPNDDSLDQMPSLFLRSQSDFKVLAQPAWWTPQRILMALGITGILGFSAILWGVLLNRKVQQQTGHIREMMIKERQSEEKYHNLFESAMDLIFITDTEGRFVALNESCLEFIGTDLERIQGEFFLQWIASTDVDKAKRAFGLDDKSEPHASSIKGEVIEVAMRRSDGQYTHVELSVRGLALRDGVFGYQAIARNVEARRQSEQQLIHSRNKLREAHQAKTDFLTMISHDLRTPMNGVLGMTQLLLQSNLNQEQTEQVRTISTASDGVLKLMLDLLEMTRMETSQISFTNETVDLVSLVDEVVITLAAEADLKQLDLVVICQSDLRSNVSTDAARIKQVLLNLVSNAIKFTDKGGIAVRVLEKDQQGGKPVFRFEIEDSGISFKKGNREKLFEILTKPEPDEPRRFGGSGLGLTLSKRIVKAMGGDIGAEQIVDKGVLLWFEIPVENSATSRVEMVTHEAEMNKVVGSMLLVSDSRFIKEFFCDRIKALPFSLETLSVVEFKEQLMSGKPWNGSTFQTLMVDCRHLSNDHLVSMVDQADPFWKNNVRWGVVDALNQKNGTWSNLPIDSVPLRLTHPLTGSSFSQFYHFLCEEDKDTNGDQISSNKLSNIKTSKEILSKSRLRVLVAEDDPINQKLIRMYLKNMGCIYKIVPEGEQAIQRLETEPYDVVLMDCNMAGVDGIEETRRLRSDMKYDDLVIIAITANVVKGHREQCFDAGMNDFLVKPLNLNLLTMKLARVASLRSV